MGSYPQVADTATQFVKRLGVCIKAFFGHSLFYFEYDLTAPTPVKETQMMKRCTLFIVLFCVCASITNAQNYYPADIGNTWVLESTDGAERNTYTIKASDERFDGEPARILEISTEVLGTSSVKTSTFLVQVDEKGMKLHSVVAELGDIFGVAHVEFSPPAIFFPPVLQLGEIWETEGKTEVNIVGDVTVSSVNEVVAIEDVVTSAGTFKDCLKIQVRTRTTAALGVSRSTSYQWLAPNLGPVKFETDQDIIFELTSSNLLTIEVPYDVNADGIINILDLVFVAARFEQVDPNADVNADGKVNILDLTLIAQNLGN